MLYDNALDLLHFEYVEDQRKIKKNTLISTLEQSTDKALAYKKILAQLKDDRDEHDIGYNYLDYIDGEFNSVQDTNINTGFTDKNGNVVNDDIFKDCYIEANGAMKYHKITDDIDDEFSEDGEDENLVADMEIINENKNEIKRQLKKDSLGLGEEVSYGVSKYISQGLVDKPSKTKSKIRFNKEKLYDELNGFFLKNYTTDTKKLTKKVSAVSNFSDILLDLDVINEMADDLLADEDTSFKSKEEREFIESMVNKAFDLKNLPENRRFGSLKWNFHHFEHDLKPDAFLTAIMARCSMQYQFGCHIKTMATHTKSGRERDDYINWSMFNPKDDEETRKWDEICNDEVFANENKMTLLKLAKIFEHLEKLGNVVIS